MAEAGHRGRVFDRRRRQRMTRAGLGWTFDSRLLEGALMIARYWRRFCRTSGALYDRRSWRCGENDRRLLLVTAPVLRSHPTMPTAQRAVERTGPTGQRNRLAGLNGQHASQANS